VTASITAKEVVILGLNGVNKTYDGMISVSLGGTPSLLGVETADQANVVLGGSPTASLVSANAGFGVGMVVSGYTLSGSEAGNYQLVQPVGLAADIQPKPATITAKNQTKTVGTVINLGPGQREFSATGLVEGEVIDTVTLVSNGGTQAQDPVGSYVITASDPVGGAFNRFRVGNYNFDYRTGTLTVSGGPATVTLADWATQNGLSGADAAPAADPDGDGVSNLMAYFMALDPKGGQGLVGYGVKEVADSSVSLTYRRAKGVTGVTAQVQSAGDLSSGWGTNGVQETVVDKGAYEEVTATVTTPPGSTKMFMRLSVQSP